MTGEDNHVRFGAIDAEAEEERSARGQQHRKDLVVSVVRTRILSVCSRNCLKTTVD